MSDLPEKPTVSEDMPKLAKGQRWTYVTRQGEETSTITILGFTKTKVADETETIVHIRINDLHIEVDDGKVTTIGHSPVLQKILNDSLVELIDSGVVIEQRALEAIADWEKLYEQDRASYFDQNLRQLVDHIQQAIQETSLSPKNTFNNKIWK